MVDVFIQMGGYFSDMALDSYRSLVIELQGADFAEGETYDFTRCVKPDGTVYGTAGQCRKGTEEAKVEAPPAGSRNARREDG